jgi:hypothetical protein
MPAKVVRKTTRKVPRNPRPGAARVVKSKTKKKK